MSDEAQRTEFCILRACDLEEHPRVVACVRLNIVYCSLFEGSQSSNLWQLWVLSPYFR